MLKLLETVSYIIFIQFVIPTLKYENGVHCVLHNPPAWAITTNSTQSPSKHTVSYRRQRGPPPGFGDDDDHLPAFKPPTGGLGVSPAGQAGAATRFTTKRTTSYVRKRTTQEHVSLDDHCEYLLHFCLRGYQTGKLCAKSIYYYYFTFKNYCMLDWMNCMLRYEMWQVVHMGDCFLLPPMETYVYYNYDDDYAVDQQYFVQDKQK